MISHAWKQDYWRLSRILQTLIVVLLLVHWTALNIVNTLSAGISVVKESLYWVRSLLIFDQMGHVNSDYTTNPQNVLWKLKFNFTCGKYISSYFVTKQHGGRYNHETTNIFDVRGSIKTHAGGSVA